MGTMKGGTRRKRRRDREKAMAHEEARQRWLTDPSHRALLRRLHVYPDEFQDYVRTVTLKHTGEVVESFAIVRKGGGRVEVT